jgi:osmotically-inducible protein OsmY
MRNRDVRTAGTRAPERAEVVAALASNAAVHEGDIDVAVSGQCVTLSGTVGTCAERREAERVVWALPGVKIVHDLIMIGPAPPR